MVDFVLAHTGNDLIDHGFTFYDGAVGVVLLIGLIIGITFLIKRYTKSQNQVQEVRK